MNHQTLETLVNCYTNHCDYTYNSKTQTIFFDVRDLGLDKGGIAIKEENIHAARIELEKILIQNIK